MRCASRQVHCAALRNQHGEIVNYVGVQCMIDANLATAKAGGGGGAAEDEDSDGDYE